MVRADRVRGSLSCGGGRRQVPLPVPLAGQVPLEDPLFRKAKGAVKNKELPQAVVASVVLAGPRIVKQSQSGIVTEQYQIAENEDGSFTVFAQVVNNSLESEKPKVVPLIQGGVCDVHRRTDGRLTTVCFANNGKEKVFLEVDDDKTPAVYRLIYLPAKYPTAKGLAADLTTYLTMKAAREQGVHFYCKEFSTVPGERSACFFFPVARDNVVTE